MDPSIFYSLTPRSMLLAFHFANINILTCLYRRIPSHIRKVALEKRSNSEAQSSKPNGLKRPAGDSPRLATKRVRSGTQHDAIVIDSDDDEQVEVFINKSPAKGSKSPDVDLKTADVLKLFRFPASSLK